MPEQDPSGLPEPPGPASDPRNLPVPLSQHGLVPHERSEGWLVWALRVIFGWKSGSIRANLTDVLKAGAGETGFSPKESVMLQNILGLRERRGLRVLVSPPALAPPQPEITLRPLIKGVARPGPSR